MSNKQTNGGFAGKGYYIALILCAAAIGISGYVYYQNTSDQQTLQQDTPVIATEEVGGTLGTAPSSHPTENTTQPADTGAATSRMDTCAPVQGEVINEYAVECLSYNQTTRDWRTHNGVDLSAEPGAEVVAAADGQVYTVYNDDEMGMTVVIRHEGGYVTKYSSLSENVAVSPGDTVEMGQTIGYVGCTALMENALGDHLHFCVTLNDESVDPMEFIEG